MDVQRLLTLASRIDQLDYYQLLGLSQDAPEPEVRKAFHKRARVLHPDLVYAHENQELRAAVDQIYRRMTEAYLVLRDKPKRDLYNQGLTGLVKRLRYTAEDEARLQEQKVQSKLVGKTKQGQKLFAQAEQLHLSGNLAKAVQNLRMALTFERDNAFFQQRLQEWEKQQKG
ncbi:MAG: DnaJ domain-containing protein [Myxococcota bacterium]